MGTQYFLADDFEQGVVSMMNKMNAIVAQEDSPLHDYMESQDCRTGQFAFRWMVCLLWRELTIDTCFRLWDTYLAQLDFFPHFHVYVCAALFVSFSETLLDKKDFVELVTFLQNLPLLQWKNADVAQLTSTALRLLQLDPCTHEAEEADGAPAEDVWRARRDVTLWRYNAERRVKKIGWEVIRCRCGTALVAKVLLLIVSVAVLVLAVLLSLVLAILDRLRLRRLRRRLRRHRSRASAAGKVLAALTKQGSGGGSDALPPGDSDAKMV
eukprot:TRINITY_DN4924_c0_g1_i3.p2 TRINITY_DN4924_c0_g1~~TRINITY_DN4924_c0_g1_i3.p2  ORF type:complete len:268 (-),score=88.85 TRINITY_DN4924_c0_g1_i3:89-892(-)